MKTFYFNIQAKGGAGKSMLTYLQALKNEENNSALFVDLDNSTKTSIKQLKFLKDKKRLVETDIIDAFKRIEREQLFQVIENLSGMDFQEYYLDFGAPESEQLPNLFSLDFTVEEFKEFEASINARFIFNIVVSGGPAYLSCMEYVTKVITALNSRFDAYLFINEFTFNTYPALVNEVKEYATSNNNSITGVKLFGNISIDRHSGQNILEFVKEGKGFGDYSGFATKTIMKRELSKV
jgi:hypothetical protein